MPTSKQQPAPAVVAINSHEETTTTTTTSVAVEAATDKTDTNNNSNNKITANGNTTSNTTLATPQHELLVASDTVEQQVLVMPSPKASSESILTIPASAVAAAATSAAAQITPPAVPPRPPSITAAIKQQSQMNNNNNSNNSKNHNNLHKQLNIASVTATANPASNVTAALTSTKSQQQLHHQHQQQQSATKTSTEELVTLIKDINFDRTSLSNGELIQLVKLNQISIYKLESFLGKDNAARCVDVRRDFYRLELAELDKLDQIGIHDRADALLYPKHENLNYERVNGACCENVIGHVKVPVGLAGPLVLDGEEIFVPLATTEGCLVASTCRGLSALRKSGGVTSRIRRDFMTRAPIIRFKDIRLRDALDNVERAIMWLNDKNNKEKMRNAFNLTSSHGKFINYTMYPVSREIHIRFEAQTGDAMGMNMCSKGVESALKEMQRSFPSMEIVTLSGNMCTDKKAAGINWINGRGKAVECNAELPSHVVKQVFKVSVDQLVDRWKSKVMIGSALAASIGGFNSQAANILTAIFIATGQDPAQNVTSSNCMLILEKDTKGSLVVCCTMPSIECGTVGGGTILGDQSRYLQMMGVRGPTPKQAMNTSSQLASSAHANFSSTQALVSLGSTYINTNEYTNARKLARIICATVMAGELSLLAALTEGTLVKSHMRHNRSSTNVITSSSSVNNLNQIIGGSYGGADYNCVSPSNNIHHHHYHHHQQLHQHNSCFGPAVSVNSTTVNNTINNHYLNNGHNNNNNSISYAVNGSCNSLDQCDLDETDNNCINYNSNSLTSPTPHHIRNESTSIVHHEEQDSEVVVRTILSTNSLESESSATARGGGGSGGGVGSGSGRMVIGGATGNDVRLC